MAFSIIGIYILGVILMITVNRVFGEMNHKWHIEDDEAKACSTIFWPIFIPGLLTALTVMTICTFLDKIISKISRRLAIWIQPPLQKT